MSNLNAEESRREHNERKGEILSLLDKTIEFYEKEEGMEKNKNVFEKLKQNLENGEFSIVVVGEFSAGKSTLLNALMKKRILPSFTNETTATVNFLRHKEKSRAGEAGTVYYKDGTTKNLDNDNLETIQKYVTTKGKEVVSTVEHLDLYLDSEFLKDGVTLVDSPGLNGIAEGHREITEQQILKSHASIFLFSCDHPGSKTDFEFLNELQKKVKTIIFVLNKIDSIKVHEGETVEGIIETLKTNYRKQFPEATTVPEIWPVAAYPALVARNKETLDYAGKKERSEHEKKELEKESRLVDFEDRLMNFLVHGEKTQQQLLAPVERVIAVNKEIREKFEKEIELLKSKIDEKDLQEKIENLKDSIEEKRKENLDKKGRITNDLNKSIEEVRNEFSAEFSKFSNKKLREIDEIDDLDEMKYYFENFEKEFMRKARDNFFNVEENLKDSIITLVQNEYITNLNSIAEKLNNLDNTININLENHLNTDIGIFEVGLEGMIAKKNELEQQLQKLKKEEEEMEEKSIISQKNKLKKEKIERELFSLRENVEVVENRILPSIREEYQQVRKEEERGGLFGGIIDFFTGKQKVMDSEKVIFGEEREEAKKNRDDKLRDLNSKIIQKEEEMNNINYEDHSYIQLKQTRKSVEISEIINKINEIEIENTKEIDKKYAKEIKKHKRKLRDYCDDISAELERKLKKELRNLKEIYTNIIIEIVEANISEDVKSKERYLKNLIKDMNDSEENKNMKIEALRQKIEDLNEIMIEAINLQSEIENIEIDIIRQEELK
jgi:hypothetical protein